MKALCLALAIGMVTASTAAASDPEVEKRYTPAFDRCLQSPEGITDPGMRECTATEIEVQDRRLNAAYAKAMGKLNDRQKAKLRAAQRAWVSFRDADCDSLYDEDWGTISRQQAMSCTLERTIQRTIDLENYPPN